MALETPTPTQSPSTTDPLKALIWDCRTLVLANLSIVDLARSQRVSKHWQECIASYGLRKHFPDKWKETVDINGAGREEVSQVFTKYAIDHTLRERWVSGKVVYQNNINWNSYFCTVAGDYRAWNDEDTILWQRLGYQDGGKLFPTHALDFELAINFEFRDLRLNSEGLLFIMVNWPGSYEYKEHLFDLNTGEELWSRQKFVTDSQVHGGTIIHMGPEVIYQYGDSVANFELYDVRTGAWLYSLPSLFNDSISSWAEVHRIAGQDMIFAVHSFNILRLIDPKNGRHMLEVGIDSWFDMDVVVSCRPNECAFALISDVDVDDGEWKKIHKFGSDADGNFIDQGVEVIDLKPISKGCNHNTVAIDPFRYFVVAPQCTYGCPCIWPMNPSSTKIRILNDEMEEIVASRVCLGDKQELGPLFPEELRVCTRYIFSIKWSRLYVSCRDYITADPQDYADDSWTVYDFGFQGLPPGLTGNQAEGSVRF